MQRLELKATHKPVQNYYAALRQLEGLYATARPASNRQLNRQTD